MRGYFVVGVMALSLAGCSSIIEGTTETLSFDSNPPGADCTLVRNGETIGSVHTPSGVVVKKTKYDINVLCKKDGYQDGTAYLHSDAAGATFGNIILGGGIGWAIDSASGADNKYTEHTTVTLVPVVANDPSASAAQADPTVAVKPGDVEARLQRLKELLDKGTISQDEYEKRRRDIIAGT
jgi:hypothetical protein